ncbi:carcinine hydrolase/isopenicillin-N N-acyltransferase family protein [Actinomadura rudentiformis]|uniref:Linear amide C-N hydrolase n=1 Tax=Actinomadura rudentiformis TaxID=359158 RepID=A0A6H9YLY3_9ACTN|nr:carcinine hydrolase/isopenicillin-N N-acyltransferase family protein [Actinomadura rudentiformis]KAB2343037.1 linear amide C-N hydrolase [Actinomadura rudentiformis]
MSIVHLPRRAVLLGLPAAGLATACRRGSADKAESALTRDEERSLKTLRLIDPDHPLFAMTLYGPYDPLRQTTALAPISRPFACSLFLAGHGSRGPLFGRNFDWGPNPALLLTAKPPNAPASLSLVDISYLGIDQGAAKRLLGDDELRRMMLKAVGIPFDGVNQHGLAVGMAAVDSAKAPKVPGGPVVGSARIQRLALDQARTVDEAVAVFRRYNVNFAEGEPPLHYLLADARGKAAAIEFVDGEMKVIPSTGDWHDMVNFVLSTADERQRQADDRYRTIADRMRRTGGRLDPAGAMDLLSKVAQRHTRWSAVYELRHGEMSLALGRDYRRIHRVKLAS